MMKNVILSGYEKHPEMNGVFLKHFFSSQDNDRLNNLEVLIEPGHEISPHTHGDAIEFFYVVRGNGLFLIDGAWQHIRAGEALMAPMRSEHGFKNSSGEPLVLFSTFSPAIR